MSDGQILKTSKRYPDVPDHLIRRIQADAFRDLATSDHLRSWEAANEGWGGLNANTLKFELEDLAHELELLEDGNFGEQD